MGTLTDKRAEREKLAAALHERWLRDARKRHSSPYGGLYEFVKDHWHILEPATPFVDGWPLMALCQHLEAITRKDWIELDGVPRPFNRFLGNVPPGFMKSLLVNVFWPAWEWGPMNMPHLRYVTFSYAAYLTERDNRRFLDLIQSQLYQSLYGQVFELRKAGETKISTDKMGWKLATSFGGVGTGERGDRVILDDPHNVKDAESEKVRTGVVTWFREAMSNRLNNLRESVVIVIMQRVHENDVSGEIISARLPYVHLMIPMEFEAGRRCQTPIGWCDPREEEGELAWDGRFPDSELDQFRSRPFMWAGQYQQSPEPRGGAIIKRDYWRPYPIVPGARMKEVPDFVLASADTAYTEKEINDPTGFTIWGLFYPKIPTDPFRILLLNAWRKHLQIHGPTVEKGATEPLHEYVRRAQPQWGICEWIMHDCRRFHVDKLIIENKASGIDVVNEIKRLCGNNAWGVEAVTPDGDKTARAQAAVSFFVDGLVYAPAEVDDAGNYDFREWAQLAIDEAAIFPNGTYKDVTDSMTQAFRYIRKNNLVYRSEERAEIEREMRSQKHKSEPLYPI